MNMNKLNLHDSFTYHIKFLKALALWYNTSNYIIRYIYKFLYYYLIFYIIATILFLSRIRDMFLLIRTASLLITMCNGSFKFLCFNLEKTKKLMSYLDEEMFEPRNKKEYQLLKKTVTISKWLPVVYVAVGSISGSFLVFSAYQEHRLPSESGVWIPYVTEHYFFLAFLVSTTSLFYLAISSIIFDCVLAGFMMQIGAQCDVLGLRLENLVDCSEKPDFDGEDHGKLKKCIFHHKLIVKLCAEFGDAFHNIMLAQFTESVLVYCQTMYLLANLPFGTEFIGILIYAMCVFMEPFLICWFGNEMTLKSELIAYKIYCCKWYDSSAEFKKDMIIFMHRLQQPLIIYVGKLFPARLVVWISISKSAWSYYLMLMKINARKE